MMWRASSHCVSRDRPLKLTFGVIEDLVAQRVLEGAVGVLAMTLTTGIMIEFVLYIAPGLTSRRFTRLCRRSSR